jgi:hypothetical protein
MGERFPSRETHDGIGGIFASDSELGKVSPLVCMAIMAIEAITLTL